MPAITNLGSHRRGYVAIAFAVALPFLLGMAGLAVDVGRMYVARNEAQSYTDAAALAAALRLDGSAAGLAGATSAAGGVPMKWQFGNSTFSGVDVQFATSPAGPWTQTPPNPPSGYHFVRVAATVHLPMYLMPVVTRTSFATISASAVAGRTVTNSLPGGEFPFSPYTRAGSPDDAADPYGYKVGNQYTLRWGAPGDRTDCGTDATQPNLSENGDVRGYCCAGSAASLREAIVGGQTKAVTIGQPVPMDHGAKHTEMSAIAMRVAMDSDTTSTSYSQYLSRAEGNGERVVAVAINNGSAGGYTAVGFAAFFLLNYSYYNGLNGGNNSACAEYIGAWIQGNPAPRPGGAGAFHLKLYE